MKKFSGLNKPWGTFVLAKTNIAEVLRKELKKYPKGVVLLSTVTDPYQPIERKYFLTRECLKLLSEFEFPVSILTKSSLVMRDIDLIKKIESVEVGMTIVFMDEKLRKIFEPKSSPLEERFKTLRILSRYGIRTWLFFGPVLPFFCDRGKDIEKLFYLSEKTGIQNIVVDSLNLYPLVWKSLLNLLRYRFPEVIPIYQSYRRNKHLYEEELKEKIRRISSSFSIALEFAF